MRLIRNSYSAGIFSSNQSALILQYVIWSYGAAGICNEKGLLLDFSQTYDNAFQPKDGPLALSRLAERCTAVLE